MFNSFIIYSYCKIVKKSCNVSWVSVCHLNKFSKYISIGIQSFLVFFIRVTISFIIFKVCLTIFLSSIKERVNWYDGLFVCVFFQLTIFHLEKGFMFKSVVFDLDQILECGQQLTRHFIIAVNSWENACVCGFYRDIFTVMRLYWHQFYGCSPLS